MTYKSFLIWHSFDFRTADSKIAACLSRQLYLKLKKNRKTLGQHCFWQSFLFQKCVFWIMHARDTARLLVYRQTCRHREDTTTTQNGIGQLVFIYQYIVIQIYFTDY